MANTTAMGTNWCEVTTTGHDRNGEMAGLGSVLALATRGNRVAAPLGRMPQLS